MLQPGIVSITFRDHKPEEIIQLAHAEKLRAIEWGGDGHVPHGDMATAQKVGEQTRAAGLTVASYGSYFRAGEEGPEELSPDSVVATARALGAPSIRIWAGKQRHNTATPEYRDRVVADCRDIADRAAGAGLEIHLEYHDWTLTNDPASARQLLQEVDRPNLHTLWQPPNDTPADTCLESLRQVLPHLAHLHVFHWGKGWKDRYPLAEGKKRWEAYLALAAQAPSRNPRYALLEFVREDSVEAFREDAQTLRQWISAI